MALSRGLQKRNWQEQGARDVSQKDGGVRKFVSHKNACSEVEGIQFLGRQENMLWKTQLCWAHGLYVINGEYCTQLQDPRKHCATMPHFQPWGTFHDSQQMTWTAGNTNTAVSLVMKMVTKRLMSELLMHPVDIPDKGWLVSWPGQRGQV